MHAAAVGSGIGLVLTNSSLELKTMRIRSADPELVCRDPHLGLRHHWSLEAGSVQRAVELRTFSFVVFPPVTLTKRCPIQGAYDSKWAPPPAAAAADVPAARTANYKVVCLLCSHPAHYCRMK